MGDLFGAHDILLVGLVLGRNQRSDPILRLAVGPRTPIVDPDTLRRGGEESFARGSVRFANVGSVHQPHGSSSLLTPVMISHPREQKLQPGSSRCREWSARRSDAGDRTQVRWQQLPRAQAGKVILRHEEPRAAPRGETQPQAQPPLLAGRLVVGRMHRTRSALTQAVGERVHRFLGEMPSLCQVRAATLAQGQQRRFASHRRIGVRALALFFFFLGVCWFVVASRLVGRRRTFRRHIQQVRWIVHDAAQFSHRFSPVQVQQPRADVHDSAAYPRLWVEPQPVTVLGARDHDTGAVRTHQPARVRLRFVRDHAPPVRDEEASQIDLPLGAFA